MSTPRLVDPRYILEVADAKLLAERTHQEVILKRGFTEAQKEERRLVSKRIGETAARHLLSSLGHGWNVTDANLVRMNQRGDDLTVSRTGGSNRFLKVSVKGSTYIELVNWLAPANPHAAAWEYDVLILVDAGVTLDRLGRFPKIGIKRQEHVAFYVFSREEAIAELTHAKRKPDAASAYIYRWWAPRRAGSKEELHQIRDIDRYRNRFETIERLLAAL